MKLVLRRDWSDAACSMGRMVADSFHAETMERPWVPIDAAPCGQKGVSCVPKGLYDLVVHDSEAHPRTWALVNPDLWVYHWDQDVPKPRFGLARTLVLIHAANYASELRGCIAPGKGRAIDSGNRRMVLSSRAAMAELQSLLPWSSNTKHQLEIL